MNLSNNPSKEQLRELLAPCDDARSHCCWVDIDGQVHVSQIPDDCSVVSFAAHLRGKMKFRLETFSPGGKCVGPEATADLEWIDKLFGTLTDLWEKRHHRYISFC